MTPFEAETLNRQRLVARLLSAAVHDARNALQGISGTAELASVGLPAADARTGERLRSILRQSAALGQRLEALLALSVDAPSHISRVELGSVCTEAIGLRQASWGRQRISAIQTVPGDLTVRADPDAVLRILLNLLLNAETSLTSVGGGHIALSAAVVGDDVVLVVEDSGEGVSSEAAPGLFTSLTHDGRIATGLMTARRLAEALGGAVTWQGADRPSAFVLRLPTHP